MSDQTLILILGLPGAGKSTLCHRLNQRLQQLHRISTVHSNTTVTLDSTSTVTPTTSVNLASTVSRHTTVHHVCYDDYLGIEQWSPDYAWKKERVLVQDKVLNLIQDGRLSSSPIIFLLDDNFYYRSMRKPFKQICREQHIKFGMVYVTVELSIALERNRLRTGEHRVSEEVIQRMNDRFEFPDIDECCVIDNSCEEIDIDRVIEYIANCEVPCSMVIGQDLKSRELSRKLTANNLKHQLDLLLRQAIQELIADYCTGDKRGLCKDIVSTKKVLLRRFCEGELLSEDGDIDVAHLKHLICDFVAIKD